MSASILRRPCRRANLVHALEPRQLLTVLTFERTVGGGTPVQVSAAELPTYGDRVTATSMPVSGTNVALRYGSDGGFTPKVTVGFGTSTGTWNSSYGDLVNNIFSSASSGFMEVTFTADAGFNARLHRFDLGGWPSTDYTVKGVLVTNSSGQTLYSASNVKVEGDATGPRRTTISFTTPLTASVIKLRIDASNLVANGTADNIGLDNVLFSQSAISFASVSNGQLTIEGTTGNDTLRVEKNSSGQLVARRGSDSLTFSSSGVTKIVINGGDGNDSLSVGSGVGAVTLNGGGGNDSLVGGGANDLLDGGSGRDDLRGGGGNDTATYASRTSPVYLFLDEQPNDGSGGERDNIRSDVENLSGGSAGDVLIGNDLANTLSGNGGNDVIFGRGGNDVMEGGSGDDDLFGDGGNDTIGGGSGVDQLFGGEGNDRLLARDSVAGDLLDGGAGTDSGQFDSTDTRVSIETIIA